MNIEFDFWEELQQTLAEMCPTIRDSNLNYWQKRDHECELCVDGMVLNDRGKTLARLLAKFKDEK